MVTVSRRKLIGSKPGPRSYGMVQVQENAIMLPEGDVAVDLGQEGAATAREKLRWFGDVLDGMAED